MYWFKVMMDVLDVLLGLQFGQGCGVWFACVVQNR